MSRVPNRYGGGARTNINGLLFEQTTSLDETLIEAGYTLDGNKVYEGFELIGMSVPKHDIYSKFLEKKDIDYKKINSKKWLPDECFINLRTNTAYIIEKKFQNSSGSVDEKLPGCHFKKWEYEKLFTEIHFEVEFLYVFNDWFLHPRYSDTLEYIERMGCHYYFNEIPLSFFGI
ncbi:MAG: hypothetical protein GX962_16540 [Epulopiscium sp.]|nr:hypothetical protein [Candidatus Epulonipiscium sp.]